MTVSVQNPIKKYLGNGSAVSFAYPYRVIDPADIKVYLNGVVQVSGYTLTGLDDPAGGAVVFSTPPANGTVVILQRLLGLERDTDYQEAAAIPTDTLDRDFDRLWMAVQDGRAAALEIVGGELLDAKGQRIVNLANPVNAQDAVTKVWAETAMSSQLSQATTQATTATTKAAEASASAASALASKNASATSETNAAASAASALASKNAAATSETNAAASAASALASKNAAATSETNALASKNAAAASAAQAAADAQYSADTKQEIIDALADGSVASINGRGGIVVLDKTDVGLGNVDNTSDANKPVSTAQQAAITAAAPVGFLGYSFGSTVPTGWLKANGAAISRTTYASLYAVIGVTYGAGNGTTTFNLPDMRGQFARGWDDGRGVDSGRVLGSTQAGQNASHSHGVNDPTHAHSISDPGHAHGVYDPGHAHSAWTDVQGHHSHNFGMAANNAGYGLTFGGGFVSEVVITRNVSGTDGQGSHGHNVGIGAAGTNIGIYGAGSNIGIYGNYTGVSIQAQGGNEARPTNVALMAIIKY